MVIQVNSHMFVDAFTKAGRSDQFSRAALEALFKYYEDLEAHTGEPIELDVIAICCDWQEMTAIEVIEAYDVVIEDDETESEAAKRFVETTYGGYIIVNDDCFLLAD